MARFVFKLPDIGEGTAEAEIAAWRVEVGARVTEDAPLVDMMTDKATVELTSPVDGVVVERAGEPGQMVSVGSALVVIETAAMDAIAASPEPQADGPAIAEADAAVPAPEAKAGGVRLAGALAASAAAAPPPPAPAPAPAHRPAPAHSPAPPVLAAPAVRARAKALGIDLSRIQPGPYGRVRHQELDAFLAYAGGGGQAPAAPALAERDGTEQLKVIGLRRKIAEKMQEAKRRIPHFAYVEEVDVTELEKLRGTLNQLHGEARGKLTLLPFLVRALTRVLPDYPQINARFDDDAGVVERFAAVHAGIATQTPNGLVVPVVRNAEARSLWDLAAEIGRLSSATRAGKAASKDLSGSTITITSLGALGGIVTTPVINRPEVAIVGVNKMVERPIVERGHITVRRIMNLSSSFDHRVVDGYDAAEFIQRVRLLLENPALLFLDE